MDIELLEEFRLDWRLSGRAHRTADLYLRDITKFLKAHECPSLADAKAWLASTDSPTVRRKRGQALRAFGRWCAENGVSGLEWARQVPLASEPATPQRTTTHDDYRAALRSAREPRHRALIELLWSGGFRRSELAALSASDIDCEGGFAVVRRSKTGEPRIVPISPEAVSAVRKALRTRREGNLLGMTSNAIRLYLARIGAPSAHAWRRGWAVHALSSGVSEASVRAAAGWASGAMVSRYTRSVAGNLAIEEFKRVWFS